MPLVVLYEQLLPKAVARNPKQRAASLKTLISILNSIVSQKPKQGTAQKYNIDAGHLLRLLSQHLVYCPKIKFQSFCPDNGKHHGNSIQLTNDLLQVGIETLAILLSCQNVNAKVDLNAHRNELATIIMAIVLIEDQQRR